MVWYGMVRYGMLGYDIVARYGMVRCASMHGMVRYVQIVDELNVFLVTEEVTYKSPLCCCNRSSDGVVNHGG